MMESGETTGFKGFSPALLQFSRYLQALRSAHARPEHVHAASEIAFDIVGFCELTDRLMPGCWAAALQELKAVMRALIKALERILFHGSTAKVLHQPQLALDQFIRLQF